MITDDFNSIAEADVYIICVADDAIIEEFRQSSL
jgi:hypothetical protein